MKAVMNHFHEAARIREFDAITRYHLSGRLVPMVDQSAMPEPTELWFVRKTIENSAVHCIT